MTVSPHRVAVLALAPVVGFDSVIPSLVLGEARGADGGALYEVVLCGLDASLRTTAGYGLVPQAGVEVLSTADTVIVPGTRIAGPRHEGVLPADVAAALARIRPGTRVVSICTGAFVLAAAGLLDGRPATTHWAAAAEFRRLYPQVQLDEDVLFVDDGDVLTSAGLAAGVDLCLHLIRSDHGSAIANAVARYCVVPPWRDGGQAQFIERAVPAIGRHTTTAAREWALAHLDSDVDVARMARAAQLSLRTFNRRFREETGMPPGAWLLARRVDRARQLLETSSLPVDEVARESGLGTGATLRNHLRHAVGVSPSAYRNTFRGRAG